MARPLRLACPGAGLSPLALAVVCLCLMTHHDHVGLETPEGHLTTGMRQLHGVSTPRFNQRHNHVGYVFQE